MVNGSHLPTVTRNEIPPAVWRPLKRPPGVSASPVLPLLAGIVLLIVFWQVSDWQSAYLAQNHFALSAKTVVTTISAPVAEESLKVGLGIVAGLGLSLSAAVGIWIGEARRGRTPPNLYTLVVHGWRKLSVLAFLIVALAFAVYESLGGGLDTGPVSPLGVLLKLVAHPSFSILAVVVSLEAKPRTVLFLLLGYGFHSTMNLILAYLTGPIEAVAFISAPFLIVAFDAWVLTRWFPYLSDTARRILNRRTGSGP